MIKFEPGFRWLMSRQVDPIKVLINVTLSFKGSDEPCIFHGWSRRDGYPSCSTIADSRIR